MSLAPDPIFLFWMLFIHSYEGGQILNNSKYVHAFLYLD